VWLTPQRQKIRFYRVRESEFEPIHQSRIIIPNFRRYNGIKENPKGHIRVREVFIHCGVIPYCTTEIVPKFVVR